MSLPQTVAEVWRDHVTLEYESMADLGNADGMHAVRDPAEGSI